MKKEVIKLLVEGDESLTSDNSFQDQSKAECNFSQKSKMTSNPFDTPTPANLPPTKDLAPKKSSFPAKACTPTAEKAIASEKHPSKSQLISKCPFGFIVSSIFASWIVK